jgi:hypothetical protein
MAGAAFGMKRVRRRRSTPKPRVRRSRTLGESVNLGTNPERVVQNVKGSTPSSIKTIRAVDASAIVEPFQGSR